MIVECLLPALLYFAEVGLLCHFKRFLIPAYAHELHYGQERKVISSTSMKCFLREIIAIFSILILYSAYPSPVVNLNHFKYEWTLLLCSCVVFVTGAAIQEGGGSPSKTHSTKKRFACVYTVLSSRPAHQARVEAAAYASVYRLTHLHQAEKQTTVSGKPGQEGHYACPIV